MRLYFAIKIKKGATLISQMNPELDSIGIDALNSISETTQFGTLHITRIPKINTEDIYLISKHQQAIDSLLDSVPQTIRNDIILGEIQDGILGRKLTGKAIFYILYALDQID